MIACKTKQALGQFLKFLCLLVPFDLSFLNKKIDEWLVFLQVVFKALFQKGTKGKVKATELQLFT